MDCEYCDGEGYVPCEECNDIPIQVVAKPIETPLEYGREVGTLEDAKCYGARQGVGRRTAVEADVD